MNSIIVASILTFLVGIGVGMLLQRFVFNGSSKVSQLENELANIQGEHLHLKDSLQQHFRETADLTNSLTNNYKALYEHLAKGASNFTEQPLADFSPLLDQPKSNIDALADAPIDYAEAGLDPLAVENAESKQEKASA